ncbi:hypothetical protein F2P81_011024 [Scophthalmus maximus]|uniref:Uncharacterized protein n=1 Tax=Scophthalmus maximus TaxID=52904 RepID=A0A6A4T0E3_SCOMX|nr:hypothetical protein F2P81_011024 [Scophthalmus maximus]
MQSKKKKKTHLSTDGHSTLRLRSIVEVPTASHRDENQLHTSSGSNSPDAVNLTLTSVSLPGTSMASPQPDTVRRDNG